MRRAASLSEQPESTKAKARRRRSSSRSALPFGLAIGVQAEKQSTYIIGFFLEEIYYILYTLLNKAEIYNFATGKFTATANLSRGAGVSHHDPTAHGTGIG